MRYVLYFLFFVTVSCSQDAYPEFEERQKNGTKVDIEFQRYILLRDTIAFRKNIYRFFLYDDPKTVFVYCLKMANMNNMDIAYEHMFNALVGLYSRSDPYYIGADTADYLDSLDTKTRLLMEIYLYKLNKYAYDDVLSYSVGHVQRRGLTNYDSLKNEFIREYSK